MSQPKNETAPDLNDGTDHDPCNVHDGDGTWKRFEMMQPMAIVTEGGMLYGTLLTLIVVPCIYDLFTRNKSMVEEEI